MIPQREFYYLRHGETDWNKRGIFQGSLDTSLNETGLAQGAAAAEVLKNYPIETICCSPLKRTRQTAQFSVDALGIEPIFVSDLREVHVGAMEGQKKGGNYLQWQKGEVVVEGAELWNDFVQRSARGMQEALSHPGPVLVVAHGAFYQAFMEFLGEEVGNGLKNCVPLKLTPPSEGFPQWQVVELG